MSLSRRTIVKGAAWSVPVVSIAATAPAFAASPVICAPSGCKYPGIGRNRKNYVVDLRCTTGQPVVSVTIDSKPAEFDDVGERWAIYDQRDSRSTLFVRITTADGGSWVGPVKFKPCDR